MHARVGGTTTGCHELSQECLEGTGGGRWADRELDGRGGSWSAPRLIPRAGGDSAPSLPGCPSRWLCRVCELREDGQRAPQCCLCPVAGGALKPTSLPAPSSGGLIWCHAACMQWIPEVGRMDAVDPRGREDAWGGKDSCRHDTHADPCGMPPLPLDCPPLGDHDGLCTHGADLRHRDGAEGAKGAQLVHLPPAHGGQDPMRELLHRIPPTVRKVRACRGQGQIRAD